MSIRPGLYDQLITESIREALGESTGLAEIESLEEANAPDYLARHMAQQVRTALRALSSAEEDSPGTRVNLVNSMIQRAFELVDSSVDPVESPAVLLKSVYPPPSAPLHPFSPLSVSNLIMNSKGEAALGAELIREMKTADSVLMLVSFIQWRGWRHLKDDSKSLRFSISPFEF